MKPQICFPAENPLHRLRHHKNDIEKKTESINRLLPLYLVISAVNALFGKGIMPPAPSKQTSTKQILDRQYLAPFEADKRKVIGLAIELDNKGKGLIDWQKAESEQQGEF